MAVVDVGLVDEGGDAAPGAIGEVVAAQQRLQGAVQAVVWAADLTAAASDGALSIAIGPPLTLERGSEAHDRVDSGHASASCCPFPTD